MTLDLQQVARAVGAQAAVPAIAVSGWSVDTRTLAQGDVYFALHGPNHDGHDYVRAALDKGASAVVVEHRMGERSLSAPVELVVEDTLTALQQLAAWARREWGGEVIGVTGS